MNKKTMNILLCIDDFKWDYSRHCAVTILSVLETNKKNKLKFYIMSSYLPEENIEELKRIVTSYGQEIEFIIENNIIPKDIKNSVINRRNLTRGTRYRLFFPLYIKNIDRLLYMDCDVLVTKDISNIYNMDMKWKAIAWWHDTIFSCYKNKIFWLKNYVNAGVLLFNANKYDMKKINLETINKLNNKLWKYIYDSDQDYLNLIFEDDILIYEQWMNYLIENKYINLWINRAEIVHCLEKPYVQYSSIPKRFINLYNKYLRQTKRKWYPYQKAKHWLVKHIFNCFYLFISHLLKTILPQKIMKTLIFFIRKLRVLFNKY